MDARASSFRCRRVDVDAVEQRLERALVDHHAAGAWVRRRGQPEGPCVQSLVENAHSRAIEEQNLQRRSVLPEEDEERSRARLTPDALLDDAAQPIEAPPQIDRLQRHEHLDAAGDHRVPPCDASTSSTATNVARSNPGRTTTRTGPTSMRNDGSACVGALDAAIDAGVGAVAASGGAAANGVARAGVGILAGIAVDVAASAGTSATGPASAVARTTRTIRTSGTSTVGRRRSVFPSLYAQCRSPFALKPRPSLYCSDVNPLSRQLSTRSAHFCSVAVMPPGMHQPVAPRKRRVRAARTSTCAPAHPATTARRRGSVSHPPPTPRVTRWDRPILIVKKMLSVNTLSTSR